MKQITINTGFGYFIRGGNIIARYDLKPGVHPVHDDVTFVELPDRAALDTVQVYTPPVELSDIEKRLAKLEAKVGV